MTSPELEGADNSEKSTSAASGWANRLGQFIAYLIAISLLVVFAGLVLAFIALVIGGIILLGWAVYHSDPGELSPKEDAGYFDLVISSRWVVWGLRAGLPQV